MLSLSLSSGRNDKEAFVLYVIQITQLYYFKSKGPLFLLFVHSALLLLFLRQSCEQFLKAA